MLPSDLKLRLEQESSPQQRADCTRVLQIPWLPQEIGQNTQPSLYCSRRFPWNLCPRSLHSKAEVPRVTLLTSSHTDRASLANSIFMEMLFIFNQTWLGHHAHLNVCLRAYPHKTLPVLWPLGCSSLQGLCAGRKWCWEAYTRATVEGTQEGPQIEQPELYEGMRGCCFFLFCMFLSSRLSTRIPLTKGGVWFLLFS